MGYFPNGTSAEFYMEQYCAHCRNWRHDKDTDTYGCPIMDLHMIWNYDAVGKDADQIKHDALAAFIPMDRIENRECRMFLPYNAARCTKTKDMFQET